MANPHLILWDIDGTLVWTGPATRRAFERAVEAIVGRAVDSRPVSFGGKTDPQIAMEILATMAVSDGEARGHLATVLRELERAMEAAAEDLREGGRVLPGVEELLERLHGRPDVVQSVLTGNVAANARLKVGAFALDRYLDLEVGAFGSDHADRNQLVAIAVRKLEVLRGVRVSPTDVWVVGDTGRDLDCARAAGARCILVATGMVPFEELEPLGADATFHDLTRTDDVAGLLVGSLG
jgi:phosphoglycolate phosphatase